MPQEPISSLPPVGKQPGPQPRVAIIGAGIAGLSAAWGLHHRCSVTLFEKNEYVGGHTNTVEVSAPEGPIAVDTGFIVFNNKNYPNFSALLDHYMIATHRTEMHFSVSARDRDLEYSSQGFSGLFADLRNLTRPRFFSMIADVLRFYAAAPGLARSEDDVSLGDFLTREGYSETFIRDHLLPMAAAIWSCPARSMLDFPARSLARFFINHGLTRLGAPSIWRTIHGGSASYVAPLTEGFRDRIRLRSAVAGVRREPDGVVVDLASGAAERFDAVVFACHGPDAFSLLHDPDETERNVLSAFRTQANRAVLHMDETLMPKRRRVWSSWNYLSERAGEHDLSVTYWMNALQGLPTRTNYFVTLNPSTPPCAGSVIAEFDYRHPVFDAEALRAQRKVWSIQGRNRIWWCGAYLGYGFHEDGLQSGLAVAEAMTDWRRPWAFDVARERLAKPDSMKLSAAA